MCRVAEFLDRIDYREAWLSLEAMEAGELPPYVGSALRGALGQLMRSALCQGSGCGDSCQKPDSCCYFALFERSRTPAGANAPKPLVLDPPLSMEMEDIAVGGPVRQPYYTRPPKRGEAVPVLSNDHFLRLEPGAVVTAGLRLLGPLSAALPGILDAVGRHGLVLSGVRFRLQSARDGAGRILFDCRFPRIPPQQACLLRLSGETERVRAVRIVFQTPAILKLEAGVTFEPREFASRFFQQCLIRAAQVHNCLTGFPPLPWVHPPRWPARILEHRLYHYSLPRYSFRQEKKLEFDGIVGYLDLAGDFDEAIRYARAAEILHFGQKATFGLGKVRVLVLD